MASSTACHPLPSCGVGGAKPPPPLGTDSSGAAPWSASTPQPPRHRLRDSRMRCAPCLRRRRRTRSPSQLNPEGGADVQRRTACYTSATTGGKGAHTGGGAFAFLGVFLGPITGVRCSGCGATRRATPCSTMLRLHTAARAPTTPCLHPRVTTAAARSRLTSLASAVRMPSSASFRRRTNPRRFTVRDESTQGAPRRDGVVCCASGGARLSAYVRAARALGFGRLGQGDHGG